MLRMIEGGDGARLALEALGEKLLRDLDRDIPVQRVSRALHTSPMPPVPSKARIS